MAESDEPSLNLTDAAERRTLLLVLGINFAQFVITGVVGLIASSTGLLAVALDNLSDSAVYVVSLYAVGRSFRAKRWAARLSGIFLITLAIGLSVEVLRRLYAGGEPYGLAMIAAAVVNAATNLFCLKLLRTHRNDGVHLKASWIFTTNDMLANLGIAASGIAVMMFRSPVPDLLVGFAIVVLVLKGGLKIT